MISQQLNFKFLLHRLPKQRYIKPKFFHSSRNEYQPFNQNIEPDAASLGRFMLAYLQRNLQLKALQIFKNELQMGLAGNVDEAMVGLALKACRGEPKLGRQIHGFATSSGFISYCVVSNSLMNLYSKSGHLGSALCVFESLSNPSIVSWNTILSGLRKSEDAFDFVLRMNLNGVKFGPVSYTTILAFCSDYEEFLFGIQLHCLVLKSVLDCEVFVGNALVSMYSRCENLLDARRMFDEMRTKDLVEWNAMISGYTQDGDHGLEVALFFLEMRRGGWSLIMYHLPVQFRLVGMKKI